MPQLSDTMTEGVVVSWEKNIGDKVSRGDVVATVETDKAIMDVEVFRDGYLSGPRAALDSVVPVGAPIAYLVETTEQVAQGEAGKVPAAEKAPAEVKPAAPPAQAEPVARSTPPPAEPAAPAGRRPPILKQPPPRDMTPVVG